MGGNLQNKVLLVPREDKKPVTFGLRVVFVPFIAPVLCGLLVPVFADAGELFRYTLTTKDGRKFEYVFESSAQPPPRSITREQAARISANWMTTFYHLQLGSLSMRNSMKSRSRIGSFALQIRPADQSNTWFSPWCCQTDKSFNRSFARRNLYGIALQLFEHFRIPASLFRH